MPRPKVKVGTQFTDLTVIEELPPEIDAFGHQRQRVRTRCICGNTKDVPARLLTNGSSTRCSICANQAISRSAIKFRIGLTYDQLTIIGDSHEMWDGQMRRIVLCRCTCGNDVKLRPEVLESNKTNSCGCQPSGNWKGTGAISSKVFNTFRRSAITRKIPFNVTPDDLWETFTNQNGKCALTGVTISFNATNPNGTRSASLDRIDSSKGYEPGNIQWLHKTVNLMKWAISQEEFIDVCRRVVAHADGIATTEDITLNMPVFYKRGKSYHRK